MQVYPSSYEYNGNLLTYKAKYQFSSQNMNKNVKIGTWTPEAKYTKDPGYNETELKRFFSVGTVIREPWTYVEQRNGKDVLDKNGNPVLIGYCAEMIRR